MSQSRAGIRQALSAIAYGGFRRFATAQLFNSLGTQLLQTAIFWQVFELTGSALLLGLTGLARAAPHIVLSLVGGVIADRLNRVRLIQVGQVMNAALLIALAILTVTGVVEVWHLYVITLLNSAFNAVTQPARTALIPSLVPPKSLINAVGLNATIGQTSQITGPALAGVGIVTVGLGPAYLLNGLLYLAAVIAIVGVKTSAIPSKPGESPWQSFVDGLSFVRSKPVILSLLLLDLGAVVLGSYRALLPIFAEVLGVGAGGYGLLSAMPGVGSLIGAGFILYLGDMKYKGLYTVFGVLGYSAALALLALSPWFYLTLLAASLLGATNSIQMIPRNSVILAISPNVLRGRVEAFRSMLAGGGPPLGYTLSGGVAAVLGAPLALVIGAVACALLVAGIGITHGKLRDPYLGSTDRS
jgi:MFS family permease